MKRLLFHKTPLPDNEKRLQVQINHYLTITQVKETLLELDRTTANEETIRRYISCGLLVSKQDKPGGRHYIHRYELNKFRQSDYWKREIKLVQKQRDRWEKAKKMLKGEA